MPEWRARVSQFLSLCQWCPLNGRGHYISSAVVFEKKKRLPFSSRLQDTGSGRLELQRAAGALFLVAGQKLNILGRFLLHHDMVRMYDPQGLQNSEKNLNKDHSTPKQ